ncbi:sulfatase-like hydrolase/transferase, partial [bacterium]|nr:sulfatase-like hydrolase/transferase [bacterium]
EKVWKDRIKKYKHYSRGPYRGGKRGIYEGGHRVPFFVCWPAGIMSPGRAWDRPVGQVDLLATFAELTKATLPDTAEEDSQSFASVLLDPVSNASRLPLINHSSNGRFSVTDGDWKLIMAHGQKKLELYDLGLDEGEKTNLIDTHPIKVKKLTDQITNIVTNGRTTLGNSQSNDTGYWKDLTWIAEEEYRSVE